jgi:hypothetical protein
MVRLSASTRLRVLGERLLSELEPTALGCPQLEAWDFASILV